MFGVPASKCICTSTDWRDCNDDCDACWGEECHAALAAYYFGGLINMNAAEAIAAALDRLPADLRPSELVNRDRAELALSALRHAGFAIVKLPEEMTDYSHVAGSLHGLPMWTEGDAWTCLHEHQCVIEFEADGQSTYGEISTNKAVDLAAALLAAAERASS